ncbi:MAG: hypothetical protein QM621_07620 [Aeromicrobium sp.]|uniref:hypothetical protein n=1 Tax=Aeromicrobium sp. TaxID=1871063 RepID=UPI0039E69AB3
MLARDGTSTRELLVCAALGTLGAAAFAPSIWAIAVIGVTLPLLYPLVAGIVGLALELPFAPGLYRFWGAWRWHVGAVVLGGLQASTTWVVFDLASMSQVVAALIVIGTVGSYAGWTALGRAFGHRLLEAGVGLVAV